MKKILLAIAALAAIITPTPQRADAYIGVTLAAQCASSAMRTAVGSDYYICYDINSEAVSVLRWSGGTYTYQAGPYVTVGSTNLAIPRPTAGLVFGSNECSGGNNASGPYYGPYVQMSPSTTSYNWANNPIIMRDNGTPSTAEYWDLPNFTTAQINTLIYYANSSIPSYRCVTIP